MSTVSSCKKLSLKLDTASQVSTVRRLPGFWLERERRKDAETEKETEAKNKKWRERDRETERERECKSASEKAATSSCLELGPQIRTCETTCWLIEDRGCFYKLGVHSPGCLPKKSPAILGLY